MTDINSIQVKSKARIEALVERKPPPRLLTCAEYHTTQSKYPAVWNIALAQGGENSV